jgi:dolichyl-phosphate beta-glucosyltransferase
MPAVCVVVPCFNEAARLRGRDFLACIDRHQHLSLCFVDDGSADTTLTVLEELRRQRPDRIQVVAVSPNGGKAAAVRAGVRQMHDAGVAQILGYWDADLSTPLAEIDRLLAVLDAHPNCHIALGSRVKRLGSQIDRRFARHVFGRVFATAASSLLGFATYDSQCGAKLFRAAIASVLFQDPFVTRWLFDLELLARLRNHLGGLPDDAAIEVPLERWIEVGGSKLKAIDMIRVPRELLKIRRAYNRK